jgi:hypothetical protein
MENRDAESSILLISAGSVSLSRFCIVADATLNFFNVLSSSANFC